MFMNTSPTFAGPNRTTYQAKIVKPDGYPLESSSVNFKFTILDPTGSCILYAETYSSVNMSSTGGLISFSLGSGVKTYPASATTFEQVFSNITPTLSCDAGGPPSYSPASSDARKIVMQFHDGAGWQTLPAMSINAVPYAMYASEASSLNGKTDADFVQLASVPTCLTTEALHYNGTSFSCVNTASVSAAAVVSALGYTPADAVSVTALSSSLSTTDSAVSAVSASVFSVAANVASVSSSVFAVSSTVSLLANTVSAITSSQWTSSGTTVFYNAGNVGIGTDNPITTLEVSGAITATNGAGTLNLRAGAVQDHTYMQFFARSANPASRTGYIGYPTAGTSQLNIYNETAAGAIGFGTNATSRMMITSAGNIGIGTTLPMTKLEVSGGVRISMEAATCTVSYAGTLRYNSGLVEYCNGASWSAFGVAGAGITLFNGSSSGTQTFVTGISGTNFDITSSNGVHTFSIPLAASSSVTAGLLSNADYTAFTNKVSATSASVISALGYAPASATGVATLTSNLNTVSSTVSSLTASTAASFSAITSSQWVTSGTAIYYNTGGVGIGTSNPSSGLTVNGQVAFQNGSGTGIGAVFNNAGSLNFQANSNSNGLQLGTSTANPISLYTNGSTKVTVTSGGYMGLGTSAPIYNLDIAGGSNAAAIGITGSGNSGHTSTLYLNSTAVSATSYVRQDSFGSYAAGTGSNGHGLNFLSGRPGYSNFTFRDSNENVGVAIVSDYTKVTSMPYAAHLLVGGNVGIGRIAPVTKLDVAGGVKISMEAATCAASYAGTLRYNSGSVEYCNGTSWAAFGVSTSGLTSLNGSSSQTQTFANGATGTQPAYVTTNGVHTLNIPLASAGSVTAGLLSNADYVSFSNKVNATSAAIISALGYTPANNAASGTYAVKSNNLSDLTSATVARSNLGLGSIALLNSVDLSGSQATGTLAAARLPAHTGDVQSSAGSAVLTLASVGSGVTSGSQYTKVTVDGKGRVTSGAQLSVTDVTTALGYTPASASASTQWITSGTAISYVAGSVGIGTVNPEGPLHILSSSPNAIILERSNSNNSHIQYKNTAGSVYAGLNMTGSFAIGPNLNLSSSPFLTVTSGTGNVGIGIAAPQEQLHLSRVLKFTNTVGVSNFRAPTADSFRIFNHDDQSTGNAYGTGDNNAIIFENVDSNNPAPDDSMYFVNHGSSGPVHALTIKGTGNIGIGLINPTAKLHLTSGSTSVAPVRMTAGNLLSSPQAGAIEYDGTSFYVTDGANSRKAIVTDTNGYYAVNTLTSAGHMILAPTGSVFVSSTAVSTNSNTGALVVSGGVGVAGNINAAGNITTTANMQAASITATSGIISPYIAGSVASGGAITIDSTTNAGKGNIYLNPNGGKVGIGYNSPLGKLHIGGSMSGAYRSWMDNGLLIGKSGDSDGGYFGLKDEGLNRQDTVIAWGDDATDVLRFIHTLSGGASDGAEAMRITAGGNVGIGTSAPAQRLSVNGDVSITGDLRMTGNDSYIWTNGSGTGYTGIWDTANSRALLFTSENSGNVGIRTTAPVTELDVSGSVLVRGQNIFMNHDAGTNVNNDYFNYDDNAVLGAGGVFSFFADSARGLSWTGANGAIAARAGYFVNNVSIGTSATTRTLEVNGSINAGGMVAETFTFGIDGTVNGTWAIGSLSNNGTVVHATFDLHVHNGSTIDALKFQVSLPTYSNGTFYSGWQELPVAFGSSAWNGQKNYVVDVLRTSASSGNPIFFRVRNKGGNGSASSMKVRMTYNSDQTFTRITHQNTVGTAFNAGTAAAGGPVDGMYGALEYSFPVAVGQGWRPADHNGLFVKNSGYVGIGTSTPSEMLEVSGSVKATAYLYTSDRRLKKDIITLPDALASVLKLRGVNFVWKNNNEKTVGFIAQEVEAVYPELVKTDKVSGFKAVQYGNIVAILVEAIKQENKERLEAQNRCEAQIANVQRSVASGSDKSDARINQLEKENLELKNRLEKIEKFLNEKVK